MYILQVGGGVIQPWPPLLLLCAMFGSTSYMRASRRPVSHAVLSCTRLHPGCKSPAGCSDVCVCMLCLAGATR